MNKAMIGSLLVGTALLLTGFGRSTSRAAPQETRTAIELPREAREVVLHEMRLMMKALNGVLGGLARGDRDAMEEAALAGGTAIAVDMDPEIGARLPEEFARLGQGTHVAFDSLAAAMDRGAGRQDILERLTGITGNCVACHDTYRIVTP